MNVGRGKEKEERPVPALVIYGNLTRTLRV